MGVAVLIVVVVLGAVSAIFGTVIAVHLGDRRAFRLAVDALAESRSLAPRSGLGDISCGGRLGGLQVVVDSVVAHGSRNGQLCTRIRLSNVPVPTGRLTADGRGAHLTTGDEAFDRAVRLETHDDLAWRARLDAPTRRELRVAPTQGWTLEDGTWPGTRWACRPSGSWSSASTKAWPCAR